MGRHDEAIEQFETAIELRDNGTPAGGLTITNLLKSNALNDPVLERPDFIEIRNRLGFVN